MPIYQVHFYEETGCTIQIVADTAEDAIDLFHIGEWNQEDVQSSGAQIDYEDVTAVED